MLPLKLKAPGLWLALVYAGACSEAAPPPYAGDGNEDTEGDRGDPTSGEGLIDSHESDTEGGCGTVDFEIEVLRPNFTFVLDSSESMQELMPDSGGVTRHLAARQAILAALRAVGERVNFAAALFPDPDASDGCAPGREVFDLRPGEPLGEDGRDGPGLEALAFTLRKHSPAGATPVAGTLMALSAELRAQSGTTIVFLLTDGAPNCDGDGARCDDSECIPNIEGAVFEGLARCDAEFNCCDELFPHLCLDEDDTARELAALAEAGIASYVIGIPGSEVYAGVLDRLAAAAGTARRDAASAYYAVQDAAELALTLTELGEQLTASCSFELGDAPRNQTAVVVMLGSDTLRAESDDGFRWTSETSLEIVGDACTAWRSGDFPRLRVFEGCTGEAR